MHHSALGNVAYVFAGLGRPVDAGATLDGLIAIWGAREVIGFPATFAQHAAWAAWRLWRGQGLADAIAGKTARSRWLQIALLFATGDFEAAVEIAATMASPPVEALARLGAAEVLLAAGRRDEAEASLRPALSFYRDAEATWYLGWAEELLAA
jgi:tetratricopeptide (TPR) repeat protein